MSLAEQRGYFVLDTDPLPQGFVPSWQKDPDLRPAEFFGRSFNSLSGSAKYHRLQEWIVAPSYSFLGGVKESPSIGLYEDQEKRCSFQCWAASPHRAVLGRIDLIAEDCVPYMQSERYELYFQKYPLRGPPFTDVENVVIRERVGLVLACSLWPSGDRPRLVVHRLADKSESDV